MVRGLAANEHIHDNTHSQAQGWPIAATGSNCHGATQGNYQRHRTGQARTVMGQGGGDTGGIGCGCSADPYPVCWVIVTPTRSVGLKYRFLRRICPLLTLFRILGRLVGEACISSPYWPKSHIHKYFSWLG